MPTQATLTASNGEHTTRTTQDIQDAGTSESEEERRHRLLAQASARCRSAPAFHRFRPRFHVIAPYGWMNDPCAPCFRPAPVSSVATGEETREGEYSVYFQWNPFGTEWGNMSWGGYVSSDLVHWRPVAQKTGKAEGETMMPSIMPEDERRYPADAKGVFSGCMFVDPTSETALGGEHGHGKGQNQELTIVYTSVSSLPIHYTLPYTRGSEKVSLATSQDGGRTWKRYNSGTPVLHGPPRGFDVTGWRDPFVGEWKEMAALLGRREADGTLPLYGILAGGIRDETPTAFLYSIGPGETTAGNKLDKWHYEGTLLRPGLNRHLGTRTGDLGRNWEVCNFVQLERQDNSAQSNGNGPYQRVCEKQHYLLLSAEATQHSDWFVKSNIRQQWRRVNGENTQEIEMPERIQRRVMWIACELEEQVKSNELLRMQCCAALDYGCLYAVNSFWDDSTRQRILWGWIPEDDIGECGRAAQGWAGCLSLPRELFEQVTPNVIGSLFKEALHETGLVQCSPEGQDDSMKVRCLGIRPAKQLAGLRQGGLCHCVENREVFGSRDLVAIDKKLGASWELETTIGFGSDEVNRFDLIIRHGSDHQTTISFDLDTSILSVDRTQSHASFSERLKINDDPEGGPLPLFRLRDPESGNIHLETLRLHIYFDTSVLEIFANDRFAISTRIYPETNQHAFTLCSGKMPIRISDTRIYENLQQALNIDDSQA